RRAMTPFDAITHYWPAVAVAIVAAMIPRGEGRGRERAGLAAISALLALAVQMLWPSGEANAAASGPEWPHLLNVPIWLPIAAAVAVLFMPRQLLSLLRGFTLVMMGVTFVASLWLLAVPMTAGWHFQYIKEWIPSIGVRYHVAIDG